MSINVYQDMFDTFFDQVQELGRGTTRGAEEILSEEELTKLKRFLLQKNKKLSQLIAKSWLPNDPEGAEIRQVILRNKSDEIKDLLKKYNVDIDDFFKTLVPGSLHIKVSWDTFGGKLEEIPGSQGVYVLPYPPRPNEVTDEQLQEWVNNKDDNMPFPPHPYIPLTSL